jgi:hypothetical protein
VDGATLTSTVHALNPVENAATFRAVVLAWCGVVAVALVAARPLLLDAVDLLWTVRRAWQEQQKEEDGDNASHP